MDDINLSSIRSLTDESLDLPLSKNSIRSNKSSKHSKSMDEFNRNKERDIYFKHNITPKNVLLPPNKTLPQLITFHLLFVFMKS